MQTEAIVSRLLQGCESFMHLSRLQALREVSEAAVAGSRLSLSTLAEGTRRKTARRHRIKCVDRLLGNQNLHRERQAIYRTLASRWLSDLPQLLIVVDWSTLSADMQWHWLRASVVLEGRSLTLYEEVHPRCHLANRRVHQRFLERLAQVLPAASKPPIVLTDAGFRTTWFQMLADLGWYWIGRVRNRDFVRNTERDWFPAKSLYAKARPKPQDLGMFQSVRSNPLSARLVLVAPPRKGRKCRYPSGKEQHHSQVKKIAACQREPWLLSSSPGLRHLDAASIVKLYAQRMRIEQQFRDTKNIVLGLGLRLTRSTGVVRLQVLLLIDHIATLARRLIGEAAQSLNLQLQLVSTNRKGRPEISVMTLAARIIASPGLMPPLRSTWHSIARLRQQVTRAIPPVPLLNS